MSCCVKISRGNRRCQKESFHFYRTKTPRNIRICRRNEQRDERKVGVRARTWTEMCRPRADQTADFRRFSRRKDRLVEETDSRIVKRVKVHSYGCALIDAGGAFDFGDRGFGCERCFIRCLSISISSCSFKLKF